MTRASTGQPNRISTADTVHSLCVLAAWSSTIMPTSAGKPKNTSITRLITASTQPLK